MKKVLSCLLAVLLLSLPLSACGRQAPSTGGQAQQTSGPAPSGNDKKISIVATTFPQYDWVRQILGEEGKDVELTLLLDDGVDLHSYQPTMEDIAKISNCDMFLYVGGESDAWVDDALASATNKDMIVISLLEVLGDQAKEEEIVEGMEHTHEHGHEEILPQDIHDRTLSDWKGSWTTIEKTLESGELDDYIADQALENDVDFDAQKSVYAQRWKSDFAALTIADTSIDFGGASADYKYIGYKLVESDQGDSVWYGFEAENAVGDAPRYVAFSDHGTGETHDHEDDHDELAHYHMRYGNEGFEALTAAEDWSPTFFSSDAEGSEISEAMAGHGHDDEGELDEHVWLSLKNAQAICTYLSEKLGSLDSQNSAAYTANAKAYNAGLAGLDAAYQSAVDAAPCNVLLFGDRFPFRYLVDDYGLEYYAAFSGCSAETEASFETIVFLANKANELKLHDLMVIETSDQSIAKTIIENTQDKNQGILVMDSMQSVTAKDVSSGTTYLSVMENNLAVLKQALA